MKKESILEVIDKIDRMGREWEEVWSEIELFFVDNWGNFATGVSVIEPPSPEVLELLTRSLEFEGSYLSLFFLDRGGAENFTRWLDSSIRKIWGDGEDIARVALMIAVDDQISIDPSKADRKELSKTHPCPLLFVLSPRGNWSDWIKRHRFLFGKKVEFYPHLRMMNGK